MIFIFFFLNSCTVVSLIFWYFLFPLYFCTVFMFRNDGGCQHCISLCRYFCFSLVLPVISWRRGVCLLLVLFFVRFDTRTYHFFFLHVSYRRCYATRTFDRLFLLRSVLLIYMPSYRNQ